MIVRLAIRNVFRNRRRTAFSLAVVLIGTALFLFVLGFISEALRTTRLSLACETGAVQIADPRLFENAGDGYDYLIDPDVRDNVASIVGDSDGVLGVAWQLSFAGLVGDETGSRLVVGRGVIPCNCIQDYTCLVTTGEDLGTEADREVVLGQSLAAALDVGIGDRVNIATGTVSGNFNAATVEVIGLLTYSLESVEEQLGLFSVAFVQRLLKTDGVERILVGLENLDQAQQRADEWQTALDIAGIPLETRTWEELNSSYASLRSFYAAFNGLAGVAVFVLVFFSVIEVLTISFLERTREIGTVRSFGTTRARVFATFLLEGGMLGLLGAIAGITVGVGLAALFNAVGVTWTPPGAAVPQAIQLHLTPMTVFLPFVSSVFATLMSAIIPSWRNARLRIVDALRSV